MDQSKPATGEAFAASPSLLQLTGYFLRLGALGFGGPVALANDMRRDLVDARSWLSEAEYDSGLAIAAACPGPLAYQLGVYCGYVRHGIAGGLAVALAFGLAPFLIVLVAAMAYTHFADNWQLRALFYGIGPVVVALIVKACWNLGRKTLRREIAAWVFALIACAITLVVQKELTALFIGAGVLGMFFFGRSATPPQAPASKTEKIPARGIGGAALVAGPAFASGASVTLKLFLFFLKTGLLVFQRRGVAMDGQPQLERLVGGHGSHVGGTVHSKRSCMPIAVVVFEKEIELAGSQQLRSGPPKRK